MNVILQPRSSLKLLVLFALTGIAAEVPGQTQSQTVPEAPNELSVTVGKSLIVNSAAPIDRISVGFGEYAEATPVSAQEVLINGKAPGETSLIIWQQGGGKLFFDLTVRPSTTKVDERVDTIRRQLKQEFPDQTLNLAYENDIVFLRGRVKNLVSADRAMAIASTLGKTVNLLYVEAPAPDEQIILKVQFASIDRNVQTDLGMNLVSTGATNTIGSITTGQFPSATITNQQGAGQPQLNLGDALNIFMLRPSINLGAWIKALQTKGLVELLAEPNVLAINGKQANFTAGGEFPYPVVQGGGVGTVPTVTIAFHEFGVRLGFIPFITPRGTIKLEVAPEVSALDYANGTTIQGTVVPGLTLRRVHTEIELESGQSFAIGGLLDRRLTETLSRIPLLADVPLLGKLFRSRSLQKQNNELLVIVTPERVKPIPEGQKLPMLDMPAPLWGPDKMPRIPGMDVTRIAGPKSEPVAMPVESLRESMQAAESITLQTSGTGRSDITFQPQKQTQAPAAAAAPAAGPAPSAPPPQQ